MGKLKVKEVLENMLVEGFFNNCNDEQKEALSELFSYMNLQWRKTKKGVI